MISAKFNKELGIVEVLQSGNFTKEGLIEVYNTVEASKSLPRNLKVLIDARDVTLNFNIQDIVKISKALKRALRQYNSISEAIILNNPFETAIATFMAYSIKKKNYRLKVFSTKESAIDWLVVF